MSALRKKLLYGETLSNNRGLSHNAVRILLPTDSIDFRNLRLEALERSGEFFATSYQKEKEASMDWWVDWCTETEDHCVIGLFDKTSLIGITTVMCWNEDPTRKTALLGKTYIKRSYRGKGLSSLLYRERLMWVLKDSQFTDAVVFHREGNDISKKINMCHGASYWFARQMDWANGDKANGIWYRVDIFKGLEPFLPILQSVSQAHPTIEGGT